MQEQRSNENVVSLFERKGPLVGSLPATPAAAEQPSQETFEEIMRRNAENQRRLRQDRNKANKSVLRSYRIKT